MLNLYKKYEPNCLKDIVGQDIIVKELLQRAKDNNLSQVIYLTGNSGIGKTIIEKVVSKIILCSDVTKEGEPCNTCESCLLIQNEKSSHSYEQYNGALLGKAEVESIVENAFRLNPFCKIKKKVICIDEFQEIKSKLAEKSLLKALEVKNPNVYWIIGSMDDSKLHIASTSRCTPYYLKNIDEFDIATRLKYVCESEKISLDTDEKVDVLFTIAEYSEGSLRLALGLLERVIYSGLWNLKTLAEELKLTDKNTISDIVNGLVSGSSSVFNFTITEDVLKRVHGLIILMYKSTKGYELSKFEIKKLEGVEAKQPDYNIKNCISEISEMYKFPFVNKDIIDMLIFNILEKNIPRRGVKY